MLPHAQDLMEDGAEEYAASPSEFLHFLDRCGVERAAIITYVSPDIIGYPPEINEWCARYCGQAPDRLIAFGSVHPRFTHDPAGETGRILDMGIRGLKFHPLHQIFPMNAYRTGGPGEGIGGVLRVAEERGVPVMVHTGTSVFPGARNVYADPMPCDDVAVDFPELDLILAHAGRPLHADTAFFLARRHRKVWLELSGIPPRRILDYLPRLSELADKCLWGSDWPGPGIPDLRRNVEEFLELEIPEGVKRRVLDQNARRLFPV
jgi:predicted TIM-barrel fold metal-dependent hydrolase